MSKASSRTGLRFFPLARKLRNARDCFYADDTLLMVTLAIFVGPPAVILALSLSKIDDAFMIREELVGTMVLGYVFQGMDSGDSHFAVLVQGGFMK